ncbi:MAG: hypothetical protein KDA62_16260 [Planctomycetales bacterium]|nr:hypothetical protein [Planctomycetales bacterium]
MSNTHLNGDTAASSSFEIHPLDQLKHLSDHALLLARLFHVDIEGEPISEMDGRFVAAMHQQLCGMANALDGIYGRLGKEVSA